MGKLKSKMTKFINEKGKGSKPNAAKEAQKWYSKALRSFRDNSVAKAKYYHLCLARSMFLGTTILRHWIILHGGIETQLF
jgi:hypothetical protein